MNNGKPHRYQHNLFVHPGSYAIKLYAVNTVRPHQTIDNAVEYAGQLDVQDKPKTYAYLNSEVLVEAHNNQHSVVADDAP